MPCVRPCSHWSIQTFQPAHVSLWLRDTHIAHSKDSE